MSTKSNTEILKEIQDIVDEYNKKKEEVLVMLDVIDALEKKHNELINEAKNKGNKNG